jgi:hypothetical protein
MEPTVISPRYQLVTHVELAEADGGAILLDTKGGKYWQLNTTGFRVAGLVIDGLTVAQIVDRLAEEMDAPRSVLDKDINALLISMKKLGFIKRRRL